MTGYPWATGDELLAADLNAAIANYAALAGGPFLPLSGGTVARHMTSTAYDANLTINAACAGSGVNGPATAQTGLTINLAKDNWLAGTGAIGEVDGLCIGVRQGGATSDSGGMLINVVGTGTGFLAIDECVVQQQQVNTGTPLYGIRTQEGGMTPTASQWIGKMLRADYGNLTTAILTVNTTGQGYWGHVLTNTKDNVQNFSIDDSGNIYAPAASIGVATAHVTGSVYLRSDTGVGINYDSGTAGIQFNIGGNAGAILGSGGLTIFGTKVVGTQIAGWGTSTGGVRGAITGSSTLPQVAAALAQLLTDLKTHGMIGT